jgi:hypothetical protein
MGRRLLAFVFVVILVVVLGGADEGCEQSLAGLQKTQSG